MLEDCSQPASHDELAEPRDEKHRIDLPVIESQVEPASLLVATLEARTCTANLLHGIVVVATFVMPGVLTMTAVTSLKKDQLGESAYWISNGVSVLQSFLNVPGLTLSGYLCQPHRVGRRRILLYLSLCSVINSAVALLTFNIWAIMASTILMSTAGGQYAALSIIFVWTTDWCDPSMKVKYFSIYMGVLFGSAAIGAALAAIVPSGHSDVNLFLGSFVLSLLAPLYICCVFPGRWRRVVRDEVDASPSAHMPSRHPHAWRQSALSTCKAVGEALSYLRRAHPIVLLVYIFINFVDTAVLDQGILFLSKELNFTSQEQNMIPVILGISGMFIQCFGVPFVTSRGANQYLILFITVLATWAHVTVYALARKPSTYFGLEWLGGFSYAAVACATGIISGLPDSGARPPEDQGTLMGTLSGVRMFASSLSPFVAALLTTNWKSFPPPFHIPGIGFAALSVIMLPSIPLSFFALCRSMQKSPQSVEEALTHGA